MRHVRSVHMVVGNGNWREKGGRGVKMRDEDENVREERWNRGRVHEHAGR